MNQWNLNGKTALVCGASKGIGRATALELTRQGATVVALARSETPLQELLAELKDSSDRNHGYYTVDFLDTSDLEKTIASIASVYDIDIIVNNTGGPAPGPLHQAQSKLLEQAFKQHILAAQTIARTLIPEMAARKYGRIINVISTSVKEPIYGLGVSNTIRGAMGNWSKTLATELGPGGITVNNVLPGFTDTGRLNQIMERRASAQNTTPDAVRDTMISQVPAGRLADPLEIAQAIAFLAMPAASYINGINLPVDGGRTKSL